MNWPDHGWIILNYIFCLQPGNIYKMSINVIFWLLISNRLYKGVKMRALKFAEQWGIILIILCLPIKQSSLESAVLKAIKILIQIQSIESRKSWFSNKKRGWIAWSFFTWRAILFCSVHVSILCCFYFKLSLHFGYLNILAVPQPVPPSRGRPRKVLGSVFRIPPELDISILLEFIGWVVGKCKSNWLA